MASSESKQAVVGVAADQGDGTLPALRIDAPVQVTPTVRFLADEHWSALERVLPPPDDNNLGKAEADRREFIEALLWMAYHGCGWSGLPAERWNADSLRRKRQRWRDRGWLELLLHAAQSAELPSWLEPIVVVAFDPEHGPHAMSVRTSDDAAHPDAETRAGASSRRSNRVRRSSEDMSAMSGAGRRTGQGADKDAGHDGGTVALAPETMEELARLIGEAVASSAGAGGRAMRGRGRSELSVVWQDVPGWAKGGFAVVIALFTSLLMAPAYLHGMSPFTSDMHEALNIPLWLSSLIVVFGPPAFVVMVLCVVYLVVRWEEARHEREREARERAREQEREERELQRSLRGA